MKRASICGKGEDCPSIVSEQLDTLYRPFAALIKDVISKLPEFPQNLSPEARGLAKAQHEDQMVKYLANDWIGKSAVAFPLENVAVVAATTPEAAFIDIMRILPRINLEDKSEPEKGRGISIYTYLSGMNWQDFYTRAVFQYLIDLLICEFLNKMLNESTVLNQGSALIIFKGLVGFWFPPKEMPEFFARIHVHCGRAIAGCVHALSAVIPAVVAEDMFNRIPNPKDSKEVNSQLFLEFFQWIVISRNSNLNFKTLPDKFRVLDQLAKKAKSNTPVHKSAMSFFTNLMGYLLTVSDACRDSSFVFDLSEIAKDFTNEKGYSGDAYTLRALLYTFSNHKKMKLSLEDYVKKYIEKNMTSSVAKYQLQSFLYFLRGFHYAAECEIEDSGENLKWHCTNVTLMKTIFDLIIINPEIYKDCQVLLGEVFIQMAASNFVDFVSQYMPKVMVPSFSRFNIHAIFHLSHAILSDHSKFRRYANQGSDPTALERFKIGLTGEVATIVKNLVVQIVYGKVVAYGCTPFVDTILLSQAKDSADLQKNLKMAIHKIRDTSNPFIPAIVKPKIIMPRQKNGWTSMLTAPFKQLVFESGPAQNIAFIQDKQETDDVYAIGVSLIPYLKYSNETINQLINLVFCPLQHVAATSLRVLQAFVHIDPKLLELMLSGLGKLVPKSNEYLFCQVQAMHHLVKSGLFTHTEISDATLQLIFQTIMIALCSDCYTIRTMALGMATDVQMLTKKHKPNLAGYLSEHGTDLNLSIQKTVLMLGCYRLNLDFSNVDPIPFQDLASSQYDMLYMFALGALGRHIRGSGLADAMQLAKRGLMAVFDGICRDNVGFYCNVLALLAGTTGNPEKEYMMQNEGRFRIKMDQLASKKVLAYCAFYSSLPPEIGSAIVKKLSANDKFQLHVITFIMRLYVTMEMKSAPFVIEKGYDVLRSFIAMNLFEANVTFKINENVLKDADCRSGLCNYLIALKKLYDSKFEEHAVRPHGPYARCLHVIPEGEDRNDDIMYAFLFNTSCMNVDGNKDLEVCKSLACSALDSFSKVYVIPNTLFNIMSNNLDLIASVSFPALCAVLENYYMDILPEYIANAGTKMPFFAAIANLFVDCDTAVEYLKIWTESVETSMSDMDQKFANATFEKTGTLLALAFFKLSAVDASDREIGFKLLFNIAMSTVLLRNPRANIAPLVQRLVKVKTLVTSQQPELAENLLVQVSQLIQKYAIFCAEQFIHTAFSLVKHTSSTIYLAVITPWIKGMFFNKQEEAGIITAAEPKFKIYSTFSFFEQFVESAVSLPLSKHHVNMIDQILQQPSDGEISTLEFFTLSMIRLQQKSEENALKCIAILTYCSTKHAKNLVKYLTTYISFRSWFYHQIQLSRIDLAFDMDRFINNIRGCDDADDEDETADEEDSLLLYDVNVKFCLRVFMSFLQENKTCLSGIISLILFFCLINYDEFDGKTTALLTSIIGEQTADQPIMLHSFSSQLVSSHNFSVPMSVQGMTDDITELARLTKAPIHVIAQVVQYMYTLSDQQRKVFCDEALRWALGCGEMHIATRCAKLYEMFIIESDDDSILAIIRTIHIITEIVSERSDPAFKNASNFLAVIVEKQNPEYNLPIQYITTLVKILGKSQQYLKSTNVEAYWLCCHLLNIVDYNQMQIVCAALRFLISALKNEEFRTKIASATDPNFKGFIGLIMNMEHSKESLDLAYELMTLIAVHNMEMLTKYTDKETILLVMLPYLFAYQHESNVPDVIAAIKKLTTDRVQNLLDKGCAGTADDFLGPIMTEVVQSLGNARMVSDLIEFYSKAVLASAEKTANSTADMTSPVLTIATSILSSKAVPIQIARFGELGFIAAHNNDVAHNTLALNFLSVLNSRGGFAQQHTPSKLMKKLPRIPLHSPIDLQSWTPSEDEDPFDKICNLPPISVIDIDYLGCQFQKPISVVVQLVRAAPFTGWTEAIFRAESLQIQEYDDAGISAVKVSPDYKIMFKAVADAIANGAAISDEDFLDDEIMMKRAEKRADTGKTMQPAQNDHAAEFMAIASKDFMPEKADIEKIGSDLLAGFNVPFFFPATLR